MKKYDLTDSTGRKVRTFTDAAQGMRFAIRMGNLGFCTKFGATYIGPAEQWFYPVLYWKEQPAEETFQDQANAAYADFRRAGGY